ACAAVLLNEKRRSAPRLYGWWLLAPNRLQNWGLLQLALAAQPPAAEPVILPGFAGARDATVALLAAPSTRVTRPRLREVATAWEKVFESDDIHAQLARRLTELDASADAGGLAGQFEEQIVDLLAEAWRRSVPDSLPPGALEPVLLQSAIDRVRYRLLDEL